MPVICNSVIAPVDAVDVAKLNEYPDEYLQLMLNICIA